MAKRIIIDSVDKFSDLPADFAKVSLIASGERFDIFDIATIDSDFYVYRTKDRKCFNNVFLNG